MSSTDEIVLAQKLAFSLFLKKLKDEFKTRSRPQEKAISCFISYAWEGESGKNEELQAELGELASALRQLKVEVMYDIDNMKDNIISCDKVLFIGTPRFKEVLCIDGKPTNLSIEYQTAMKKDKSAIVPLWYRGDSLFGAFPEELHNTLIRDFRNFSCFVHGMTSLTHKGLIPSLFSIPPDDRQYGALVADLEKNLEIILSGNLKSAMNNLLKEHQQHDSTNAYSPANAKQAVPVADHKVSSALTRNVEMQEGSSLNMDHSRVLGIDFDLNLFDATERRAIVEHAMGQLLNAGLYTAGHENLKAAKGARITCQNSKVTGVDFGHVKPAHSVHENPALPSTPPLAMKFPLVEADKMLIDKFKNLAEKYLPRDDSKWRDWIDTHLSALSENTPMGARKAARLLLNDCITQLEEAYE